MLNLKHVLTMIIWIVIPGYEAVAMNLNCSTDFQLDDPCATFCYKLFKPVLLHNLELKEQLKESKKKFHVVDEKINEMSENATRQEIIIKRQTDQLAKLDIKLAEYEDTVKYRDNQINILISKNIELHNNQIENEKRDTEIENLKSEVESKNRLIESFKEKISLLESQLETSAAAESCVEYGNSNELHSIRIAGMNPFMAACESGIFGPGWMVIQRRIDGSVDFNRNWQDYRNGFGMVSGEFWLGLEKLYRLTTTRRYELYVQVVDLKDDVHNYRYDRFEIGSEAEKFILKSLGKYTGEGFDCLRRNVGIAFTTLDQDNDNYSTHNLAISYGGAWWHVPGPYSNLNTIFRGEHFWWGQRIKTCQMLIRPLLHKYSQSKQSISL